MRGLSSDAIASSPSRSGGGTLDKYFGALIFRQKAPHSGMILLPDVRVDERLLLVGRVLALHDPALESGAVITVRGRRLRVSWPT